MTSADNWEKRCLLTPRRRSCMFLPDSLLLSFLQLEVPPQHRHDRPLLLLRQVTQVNHGSSSWLLSACRCGNARPPAAPLLSHKSSNHHIHVSAHCYLISLFNAKEVERPLRQTLEGIPQLQSKYSRGKNRTDSFLKLFCEPFLSFS